MDYHLSTQCEGCQKEVAYEEIGTPTNTDIETREGIRKITKRTYKCRFCGDEEIKKFPRLINNEPE